MHRSRLAGFIIDCHSATDLETATRFWSAALGMDPGEKTTGDGFDYIGLDGSQRDLAVEVQSVDHPSRVHLDIESDDVEAEVKRLEALGARRVKQVRTWWVMEAPSGQRFCVIRAKTDLTSRPGARVWDSGK
jgi:catechol 2,3-dioxygenase-like lactoylglutathione lyase family enzyme